MRKFYKIFSEEADNKVLNFVGIWIKGLIFFYITFTIIFYLICFFSGDGNKEAVEVIKSTNLILIPVYGIWSLVCTIGYMATKRNEKKRWI
jgi:hypothetical protein